MDVPDEVREFRTALSAESDRGCALMGASYLDFQLERLLRARLVDDSKVVDHLIGLDRPLSTFSVRIDTVYLLGLLGPDARRDLHLIRKIRNGFGHSTEALTFDHQTIAARCREMTHSILEPGASPRSIFINVAFAISGILEGLCE